MNKILPDNSNDPFWKGKKDQEGKYLELIEKTFKLPLLQEDMKADNIEAIADRFAEFM